MNPPPPPFAMFNSTYNINSNQNYSQAPVNTQFFQNPNPNAHFTPFIPNPHFNNSNNGSSSIPHFSAPANAATPPPCASSSHSFTFTPQNNPNTLTVNNLNTLNLEETIRVFKELISHAESTVKQVTSLVKLNYPSDVSQEFSVCPFDYRHRMPPEHLFRHSLSCPASPAMVDMDILSTLRYPKTLKSDKDLSAAKPQFLKTSPGSGLDLCISIEEEEGVWDDFFYRDAPGVINLLRREIRKTFTLPRILSVECVENENGNVWLSGNHGLNHVMLLPSELWALRRELAGWNEFPSRNSFVAVQTAMGLGRFKESEIVKWVLLNSPAYGIMIDLPMARHIVLLLKLCLRAVSREAFGIYEREQERKSFSAENKMDMDTSIDTMNTPLSLQTAYFDSPVLLESAAWLASQMSILYGQAKGLVIGMLKHSFICAGTTLLFPVVNKEHAIIKMLHDSTEGSSVGDDSYDGNLNALASAAEDGTSNENIENDLSKFSCNMSPEVGNRDKCEQGDGLILESRVFLSQVIAAIAALQERFHLEERIKGLRNKQRPSKFQLLAEHDNAVKKAAEERQRRLDYKPILEHDGLVWQRSSNQNSNKNKSREELLAEERDYKRRRMSYRGKKVKRTPSQVLHDIIEGHMEEIELAGGIGCFIKGAFETPQIATESIPSDGTAGSTQQFGSTDAFLSNKDDRLSFSSNAGQMDLERTGFSKSRSSSQIYFDGHNRLDRHEHRTRNDYAQDDDNIKRYSDNLFYDDDVSHISGSTSEKKGAQGYETRYDSRSHDRKAGICFYEERHSRRSHHRSESKHLSEGRHRSKSRHRSESRHKSESRHRSRSHERKQSGLDDKYDSNGSPDRHQSPHRYTFYENAHRSKEQNRGSKRDR